MTRFRLLALLASLLLLFGSTVACGGGDDDDDTTGDGGTPTRSADQRDKPNDDEDESPSPDPAALQEYFTAIDTIFEAADSAADEAQTELAATSEDAPLDEQKAAIDAFLTHIIDVFIDASVAMDELNAPEEVSEDSSDFVDATDAAIGIAIALRGQVADAETRQQVDEIAAKFDSQVSLAVADADAACVNLQDIADENSIDIDLDCED